MPISFDDLPSVRPSRVSEAFNDLPDAPVKPETTWGEFGSGLGLQLGRGIQRASRDTLALGARAATAVPDAVTSLLGLGSFGDTAVNAIGDFFEPGIAGATELMPAAYQSELGNQIIGRNEADKLTFNAPTGEQLLGTLVESIPAVPGMVAGGQGLAAGGGRLATFLGYGASNAAGVSQGQYFDTRKEALGQALGRDGAARDFNFLPPPTPEEAAQIRRVAEAEAQQRANAAQAGTALLSGVTGGLGGVLSRTLGGNASSLLGALGRGFAADAPLEGVEEAGQNLIADAAMGRAPNWTEAANAGALGMAAGGAPGAAIAATEYLARPRTPAPVEAAFDDLADAEPAAPSTILPTEDTTDLEALLAQLPTPSQPEPAASPSAAPLPAQAATSPAISEIPSLNVTTTAAAENGAVEPFPAPNAPKNGDLSSTPIDPDARAAAAFDRDTAELNLPPEQLQAVRSRLSKPLPRDRVTGLYRPEELDATILAAQESGPGVYVEADLSNLGGLNAKLGASGADTYLKQFADTVRAELEPLGATVGIRKGGDELGFVVQGAAKADVDAALSRARSTFATATQEFADLPHPKGSAPGVGFHYGTTEFAPGNSIRDILQNADTQVELRKKGESYEQRIEAQAPWAGAPDARAAEGGIAAVAAGNEQPFARGDQAAPAAQEVTQPPAAPALAEQAQDDAGAAADPDVLGLRQEIGWSQRGGNIIRSGDIEMDGMQERATGGVAGRTQWVGQPRPNGGFSDFWRNRPVNLNEAQANAAFDRYERGEPLTPRQQQFIDYAKDVADGYRQEADASFDVPFSRAASPIASAVQSALGPAAKDTNVIRTKADLPREVARRVGDLNERTEGFFDPTTGQSWIFEDQVQTPERAVWVAFHERAGHVGLRGAIMQGNEDRQAAWNTFAETISRARQNPVVAKVADVIRKQEGYGEIQSAEEALAELAAAVRTGNFAEIESRYGVKVEQAQRKTLAGFIARLVQQLKAALNKALGRDGGYTDADVYRLLEDAWRYVRDGGSAMRRSEGPVVSTAVESRAQDQTETPAFRKWFGASKVLDAAGKPLVVYHGTGGSFDAFQHGAGKGAGGRSARLGFFFTDAPAVASQYATETVEFERTRGYERAYQMELRGRFDDAEALNRELEAEDFTGGKAPNVIPAYLSMQNPMIVEFDGRSYDADRDNLSGLINDAKAAGHDGLIFRGLDDAPREGLAPSDHFVVFRPEQIKSATGNSGAFDPGSPSILESRRTRTAAEQDAERSRNTVAGQLPVSRGTPGWNYDESVWEGRKGQLKRARATLQDKMTAWQDVQSQIATQLNKDIPDVQNVYQLENLMHGRVSEGIDRIEQAQIEPLVKAMRDAKVSTETLEEYLYARHAKERNAQIASINPAMPDGGSGMTNAEADKILADADKATLEPLAKRVDAITKANRKRLLDAGLITQESYDAMEAQYSAYVPLRGKTVKETDFQQNATGAGRGIDTRRSPVQQAMGRGAGNRAQNILGEIIGDAQRGVILAEKARVGRAVMRLVLANPNPALWTVEPVQTERKTDSNGEVYEAVVQDWSDPSIVAVKVGGKAYKVQINSQPLAQALNNVGVDNLDVATRVAGKINRYFSAVLTQYNPAFVPVNATRDALFGLTGLAVEHGELAALDAALHYPQAAAASFKGATNRLGSGQWDTWAREFAEAGGKTGYVSMPSVEDMARNLSGTKARANVPRGLKTVARAAGWGTLGSYKPEGAAVVARAVGDLVSSVNDAVENALRLSAYVTLRKSGMSVDKAATYAKNLTVNFNRKGREGSRLNAWFLFYNAATQGAVRTATLLKRPKTYAYLGTLAGIQVAGTMALMGMEDDEGESLWNKIPDHVKRRNIVLPVGEDHILTIPMPYGFNLFTYMAGRTTAAVTSDEGRPENRAGKLTADVMSAAAESFMPVPIGDGARGFLPTVLRIPTNIQSNRNDFGRQIRQENPYGKFDVPRASIGRPDTLELFKVAATGLNRIGGGDEYTPPPMTWFDHAPEDIKYLLGELTGGAGKFVIDVATVGEKAGGEQPVTARDIPIASRYVTKVNEQAAQQALYYERSDALNRSLERLRDTFERQGEKAAEKMLQDDPQLSGVVFKRRKNASDNGRAGSIIVTNGRPQVAAKPGSMFDAYKDAEKVVRARNEAMREAYGKTPASLIPTAESRARDKKMLEENKAREEAQRKFNAAWLRDVVSKTE